MNEKKIPLHPSVASILPHLTFKRTTIFLHFCFLSFTIARAVHKALLGKKGGPIDIDHRVTKQHYTTLLPLNGIKGGRKTSSQCYKTFFWRKSRKSRFPLKAKQQEYAILKAINSFRVLFD